MYEPANRITEIKEMRKDVLFLYEKGLDPETISRRRSVDKNVVLSLIGNYLKNEGRIFANYPTSANQRRSVLQHMKNKKPSDASDASMEFLIPEAALRKISNFPEVTVTGSWIENCALNFKMYGYLPSEVRMPPGTDPTLSNRISGIMSGAIKPDHKEKTMQTQPLPTSSANKKPLSEPAQTRGLKNDSDIQNRVDLVSALLRTAYNYDAKKADEIAYVGKYYLLGNDVDKIARLMAMEKDTNRVSLDLREFKAAEECLLHPEKQSSSALKKQPSKVPAHAVKSVLMPSGQHKNVPVNEEELVNEYKAGASVKELSEKYKGVTAPTIRDIIRSFGIDFPQRQRPAELDIDAIIAEYEAGASVGQIAEKYGTSYNAVYARLKTKSVLKTRQSVSTANATAVSTQSETATVASAKPTMSKAVEVPAAQTPTNNKRKPEEKFGSMDFFLDMYMTIATIPGVTALDFMRWMLDIADSASSADKTAVTKKMMSVIAASDAPAKIDISKLMSTVETYVEASDALAQM